MPEQRCIACSQEECNDTCECKINPKEPIINGDAPSGDIEELKNHFAIEVDNQIAKVAKKLKKKYQKMLAYLNEPSAQGSWGRRFLSVFKNIPRYQLHPQSTVGEEVIAQVKQPSMFRRLVGSQDGMHFYTQMYFFLNNTLGTATDDDTVKENIEKAIKEEEISSPKAEIDDDKNINKDFSKINVIHGKIYKALTIDCKMRDERAATIIHEVSHVVEGNTDYAYHHGERFYHLTHAQRMKNASTLERYAGFTVGLPLRRPASCLDPSLDSTSGVPMPLFDKIVEWLTNVFFIW